MPQIPAVCGTCGTMFPSGIVMGEGASATFVGNTAGPCPNCGGMGRIPDGLWEATRDATLTLSQLTRNELTELRVVIEEARARGASTEEIRREVEERVPTVSGLLDQTGMP